MDVPDVKGRTEILKVHARNKKLADEVSLDEIAQRTPGFSGADLANLLNEVRLLCFSGACFPSCQHGTRRKAVWQLSSS